MRTLTAEELWKIPRVGAPIPSPFGTRAIVPVTTYSSDSEEGTTRLYLVSAAGEGPEPRALTTVMLTDIITIDPNLSSIVG